MYKKILVPLDGSPLAETVLPHLDTIARSCSVPEIILLRAVDKPTVPVGALSDGSAIYSEAEAAKARQAVRRTDEKEAADYLAGVAGGIKYGATVKTEIIGGKAAETIVDYAKKENVDLIIIATHGRSGPSRWMWGSTADKVLRSSCVPVFMVRPPGCIPGF